MASRNEFPVRRRWGSQCSCGFAQEEAFPCRHICAACLLKAVVPMTLVIPEDRAGALQALYAGSTVPLDITLLVNDGMQAPAYRRGRELPKMKLIGSVVEAGQRLDRRVLSSRASEVDKGTPRRHPTRGQSIDKPVVWTSNCHRRCPDAARRRRSTVPCPSVETILN